GNTADMLPQIQAGRLRLLASVSPVRWKEMPDVPTLRELGFDVAIDSWLGLAAPAGVPAERLQRLRDAFTAAADSEDLKATLLRLSMYPEVMTGDDFRDFLKESHE